jgi:hypothetical protein
MSRHSVAVHATPLGASLRSLFRGLGYTPVSVRESMAWIEDHGTATGCESIDPDDLEAVQAIIETHAGRQEYAIAADWPALFDEFVWTLDDEPTAAVPSDAGPFTEPSEADRVWLASNGQVNIFDDPAEWDAIEAAALDLLTAGLIPNDPFPAAAPISGGSPEVEGYTITQEGQRWVLRFNGRAVFQSPDRAEVEDERRRRSSVPPCRPMNPITDFDMARSGAVG